MIAEIFVAIASLSVIAIVVLSVAMVFELNQISGTIDETSERGSPLDSISDNLDSIGASARDINQSVESMAEEGRRHE